MPSPNMISNSALRKRRCHFVLYHFYFSLFTHFVTILDSLAADIKAYGSVEFQSVTTSGCSGLPDITPDLSRNWLIKIHVVRVLLTAAVSLRNAWDISDVPANLLYYPHVAFDFGFWSQRQQSPQRWCRLQKNGSAVLQFPMLVLHYRLRNQQVVYIYPQFGRIETVEGVFSINKRGDTTCFCASAMAWIARVVFTGRFGP